MTTIRHCSIIEFGRGHPIKQSSRASPDLYTPLLCTDNWITIIRWWWLSQWLVTYGHHLAVTIYLHVAPSSRRHNFCVERRSHLSWFGHVSRMPRERLTRQVLLVKNTGTRPKGRSRNRWTGCISDLARSHHDAEPEELSEISETRGYFVSPLPTPPPSSEEKRVWKKIIYYLERLLFDPFKEKTCEGGTKAKLYHISFVIFIINWIWSRNWYITKILSFSTKHCAVQVVESAMKLFAWITYNVSMRSVLVSKLNAWICSWNFTNIKLLQKSSKHMHHVKFLVFQIQIGFHMIDAWHSNIQAKAFLALCFTFVPIICSQATMFAIRAMYPSTTGSIKQPSSKPTVKTTHKIQYCRSMKLIWWAVMQHGKIGFKLVKLCAIWATIKQTEHLWNLLQY